MPFAKLGGVSTCHEDVGASEPLILIPGKVGGRHRCIELAEAATPAVPGFFARHPL